MVQRVPTLRAAMAIAIRVRRSCVHQTQDKHIHTCAAAVCTRHKTHAYTHAPSGSGRRVAGQLKCRTAAASVRQACIHDTRLQSNQSNNVLVRRNLINQTTCLSAIRICPAAGLTWSSPPPFTALAWPASIYFSQRFLLVPSALVGLRPLQASRCQHTDACSGSDTSGRQGRF